MIFLFAQSDLLHFEKVIECIFVAYIQYCVSLQTNLNLSENEEERVCFPLCVETENGVV